MARLILLRHGESAWNAKQLFTGWVDVPLSAAGIEEALEAGRTLREETIDVVHTSTLIRAQMTAMLALSARGGTRTPVLFRKDEPDDLGLDRTINADLSEDILPVYCDWRLNERNYGALQGLNKGKIEEKHGVEQVQIWRRSFDVPPPSGESLKLCAKRTLPYLEEAILPDLEAGRNVLIAAHGNSLRSIVMSIMEISKEDVISLEIPTAIPWLFDYSDGIYTRLS
jgi:2,3-bisphosphoglycerate-dependent phosphoglycerate mutase